MMIELIFVRHGETNSNKRRTYLGWTDVELNTDGIHQGHAVKERLKDVKVDAIYSSPLKRAKKTAEVISENYNIDIVLSDHLKERNFGIWDDLTLQEITTKHPEEYNKWIEDWINYSITEGESALDSYKRSVRFIEDIVKSKEEGTYLIVSHLGTIRFMLSYLLGMKIDESWRFRLENCGITKVEVTDDYGVLTLLNG